MDQAHPTRRSDREARARAEQQRRHQIARRVAEAHAGVASRALLRAEGLTRDQIRAEVERGVWQRAGCHTLSIDGFEPRGRGVWWLALWESGARSVLDGVTALFAAGLTGWREDLVHVSVPSDAKVRPLVGVRHHHVRLLGDTTGGGLRRTRPEVAAVRAAQWARTDRQATTLIAMTVQQRLVRPDALLERWESVLHSQRRAILDAAIRDVCDGAHSMSEIDFARLCRARGLPEPSRQVMRSGERGRVYLDVYWDELGVHVEIQGAHHSQGTAGIDDALRFNALSLDEEIRSFQVPVLGLRTCPDRFLDQIERAIHIQQAIRRSA